MLSALDRANEAQSQVNKDLLKMMWAQQQLRDDVPFLKTLSKEPKKLAGVMFEMMAREDLLAVAKQLAQHCAVDALQDVLLKHRDATLGKIDELFEYKCSEAIKLNTKAANLRTESGVGTDAAAGPTEDFATGPTGPTEDAADGPTEDVATGPTGPTEDFATGPTGPTEDAATGPTGPNGVAATGPTGPNEVVPVDTTPQPQPFASKSHWIKSSRASSGYKNVNWDKRRLGWRAKANNGSTIGRYNSVEEAAEAYYLHCKIFDS